MSLRLERKPKPRTGTILAKTRTVVFSTVTIVPSPKQRAHVIEILRSVLDLTRPTPGCLGCYLAEEDSLQKPIRYAEQWESEETLHVHLRSELYHRVLEALELSKRPPEVKFYFTSETKGFELVESVRSRTISPQVLGAQQFPYEPKH